VTLISRLYAVSRHRIVPPRPALARLALARLALTTGLLVAVAPLAPGPALAQQQGGGWFMPEHQAPAAGARPTARQRAAPAPAPMPALPPANLDQQADLPPAPVNVPLPPMPEIPPIDKGTPPPASVVGVLSVPDVLHNSSAAQQVEKVINQRREKLQEDANKEQQIWQDMQQSLANQRSTLSQEALNTRARELQERIANAQRSFRERNDVIQNAAQYSLQQIERVLVQIIKEVSQSRGMNLVLHRSQVALNINEFDITEAVTAQLNKVLPSVEIPADGVTLAEIAKKMPPESSAAATPTAAKGPQAGQPATKTP
jgi:Skp family chaperone for outer membrane proteins